MQDATLSEGMPSPSKPVADSGNSEESLIKLINSLLSKFFAETNRSIADLRHELARLEAKTKQQHREIMTGLENITASVDASTAALTEMTTAVNDAITHIGSPSATDAQLTSLAGIIDHNTAVVKAQTAALQAAIAAVPPAAP